MALFSLPTFFLSLAVVLISSHSSSIDTFVYGGCTQQTYEPNSPYESNLNSLLTSLVNSATFSSYNNFTIMGSTPQDVIYGLYQCRGDLSVPDCSTCVASSVSQLGTLCSRACGGAVQLQGCYVKYDNTTFLGVEDTSVVLKKCGPSVGYDGETMGVRDTVMASLLSGGGLYRVSGAEEVQGVAQCVGDLSGEECQDCLSEAIKRLKSDCGVAVYGDMYLGKCYARYSTKGSPSNSQAQNDNSSNGAQKAFAIVIGLLAGVALLIIFLTFLRRFCEEPEANNLVAI
ncbi:Stress-antifung domain-containing protein [Cephalotus follicularis]|uniref:Stress-antifung domain-containing protein n=1 Tax=Cephalotus follicularis TaxID=3775 RepID=A0A1Q3AXW5_CEPFO|nr:Stress-antifung domain-containing protein [Cephalotus follicularis]